jgi:hypothetical protein
MEVNEMAILPKKQKQKLLIQLLEKIIDIVPVIIKILVVSIIGTYLRWNPVLIVTAITAAVGNDLITINVDINKDSKKD